VYQDSGIAILFMPGASNHNGRHWQKLRTVKISQLFIEFTFIFLNNVNFVERRKYLFLFKMFVLPPILPTLYQDE
jgi:hypothetical protein